MRINVNEKTNEQVKEALLRFPDFAMRSKLAQVLKARGMTMKELSDLTGIRVATISELCNMKRTTISVPHLITIALTLRITDIGELLTFIATDETREQFKKDNEEIDRLGMLQEQDEFLAKLRTEKNTKKPTAN